VPFEEEPTPIPEEKLEELHEEEEADLKPKRKQKLKMSQQDGHEQGR